MRSLITMRSVHVFLAAAALAAPALAASGSSDNAEVDEDRVLTTDDLGELSWRSVGPANMGGRVAALAMSPSDPHTFFIGYATGGVWKTTNNGTTYTPVFDDYETSSIGSLAVADAPPDWSGWAEDEGAEELDDNELAERGEGKIVWVGTGEGNGRNSSSWGHGVYRSTDGGSSFDYVGLKETHDIPALAVDPRDPDVCYVAALGHLWGANEERGVYKTTNGGETWEPVLQIDEDTGAIDVVINPEDPDTVYAAMYMRRRTPWSFRSGGPQGGVFRSTDGGRNWTQLTEGLPEQTGRIGLDIHEDDPSILYAVIESDVGGNIGGGFTNRSRAGGVFRSEDGGDTWERRSDFAPRSFYFSKIYVDPHDPDRVYTLGWQMYVSEDGGETFRAGVADVPHVDFHAMVIDPENTDRLLVGNDGGLYISYDRGRTWDFHNHMAVGQFYNVAVDEGDLYRVGGGLQDNGSWIGPSETITQSGPQVFMGRAGAITNHEWQFIYGGDGFHVSFDPVDPNIVYAESQGGNIGRVNLDTGVTKNLAPAPKEGQPRFRFNWNAPFFISPHDPTTLYLAGNYVYKLTGRGERWERISEDLSRAELERVITVGSDAETYGTVVSLAESPLSPGMLWAGTDDGLVHVSPNDGGSWVDVTPQEVDGLYISCIEASRHDQDTAYLSVDGHRSDRFEPILLVTEDAGQSWESIVGDLPEDAAIQTVREDPENPNVLYVGTERAAFVTIDRGGRWIKLNGESLPTVPVDDLKVQRTAMDLVAGTHGRSIWILDDITPLSQMTPAIVQSPFHVFEPIPAKPRYHLPYGGLWSDRMFIAQNPPTGAYINYWVREYTGDPVSVRIADQDGQVLRTLSGSNDPGVQRVVWDLQRDPEQRLGNPHGLPEFVEPGEYTVTVTYGDHSEQATVEVFPAPGAETDARKGAHR